MRKPKNTDWTALRHEYIGRCVQGILNSSQVYQECKHRVEVENEIKHKKAMLELGSEYDAEKVETVTIYDEIAKQAAKIADALVKEIRKTEDFDCKY